MEQKQSPNKNRLRAMTTELMRLQNTSTSLRDTRIRYSAPYDSHSFTVHQRSPPTHGVTENRRSLRLYYCRTIRRPRNSTFARIVVAFKRTEKGFRTFGRDQVAIAALGSLLGSLPLPQSNTHTCAPASNFKQDPLPARRQRDREFHVLEFCTHRLFDFLLQRTTITLAYQHSHLRANPPVATGLLLPTFTCIFYCHPGMMLLCAMASSLSKEKIDFHHHDDETQATTRSRRTRERFRAKTSTHRLIVPHGAHTRKARETKGGKR